MSYWRVWGRQQNDTFLFSFPKSGRTWLRFLLTYYQLQLVDIDYHLTLQNFYRLSPNVTLLPALGLRHPLPGLGIFRLLGTHSECPFLFRGVRVIMLRRDIRDVLVSYYHQRVALGEFRGDMDSFVWSPWGVRRVVRYQNCWSRALERFPKREVLRITYEELRSDTEACVLSCLDFMHLPIDDGLVARAISFASVENMRSLEAEWGRADVSAEKLGNDRSAFRVRSARVGGYRKELSAETAAAVGELLRKELFDSDGYDY